MPGRHAYRVARIPGAVLGVVSMPGDAMPEDAGAEAELWLPLRQAGPRLGLRPDTVRKKLRRGELTGRKANDGSWLVRIVPGGMPADATRHMPAPARHDPGTDATPNTTLDAGELRTRLAAAEATLAEVRATVEAQREHIADLRAELERRRWPGVVAWWRRFWRGEE